MGELLIGVFEGEASAARVLDELKASGIDRTSVASAGTVSVGVGGAFEVRTSDQPGSRQGFSGMFWEALFGLVLLVHVPGSSYGPNAGAFFETLSHAGVDESFRARVRVAFTPDTSAIAMLANRYDAPSALRALLAPYGARIVSTTLSPDQDAELARELGRAP